jgi:RNA polymerase sigma-70 factor (ECF subfamily)
MFRMSAENALKRPAPVEEDDEVLVERAAAGDRRAFTLLYRRHARYLAGVAFRLLGDSGELDDVVQETFVGALQGLNGLHDASRLRAWLVTILVRRVQRRMRSRTRQRWLGRELLLVSPTASDPHVSREVSELYRALERLPIKLRVPWTLARVEGGRMEEVAEWCDVSVATLKRRLNEADELLARRMGHG